MLWLPEYPPLPPAPVEPPTQVAPRATVNRVARQPTQAQLAAENAPLRITYGQDRIGALIADALIISGRRLVLLCVWGEGEIDAVEAIEIDDEAAPAGTTLTHYTGTAGQTVNSTLVAAYAAQSPPITFTDALPGVAYSVIVIPAGTNAGFPRVTARLRGRKIYDPRQNLLLQSADMTVSPWTKSATLTCTANGAAPDGSGVASFLLDEADSSNLTNIRQDVTVSPPEDEMWVGQMCIAPGTWTGLVYLGIITSTVVKDAPLRFNLTTGAFSTVSGNIAAYGAVALSGGGWRIWLTMTMPAGATAVRLYLYPTDATAANNGSVVTWAWSLEQAVSAPGVHMPTTTTARNTQTAYSTNPALALGDFLRSTTYGMGLTLDEASVGEAAAACDVLVGGLPRRSLGLTLASPQSCRDWVEALRTYAGCWVVQSGSTVKLVPDRPRATDVTLAHASGQILAIGPLKKRGVAQAPTAIEVRYTDTTTTPWREMGVTVLADGVSGGTVARRDSVVHLPGIHSRAQALREATERLNKMTLSDLAFELEVFDEMLKIEVGDVVAVTHPIGLTDKLMRVLGLQGDLGRYQLNLTEYDPGVYSDAVESDSSYADTTLDNPFTVPAVTGLTLTEEVYQTDTGIYASRIKATWTAPDYAYLAYYRIRITAGADLTHTGTSVEGEYRTAAVQEGVTYQVSVTAVSSLGIEGAAAGADLTAAGKSAIPGSVAALTGFEAGGIVFLAWTAAVDLDIWRYELRYGLTSGDWDSATVIDRIDGLRYNAQTVPPGSWRFYVKAVDSVAQYSTTAATLDLTVTSDVNSFLVDRYYQTAPTLTNMASYALNRHDGITHWVSEDGVAAGTKYSSTMSSYTNPLATYHSSMTSEWLGEAEDFGQDLSGDWTGESTATAVGGTITQQIGTKTAAAGAYTYATALTDKTTARYARLKHGALTTSTLHVQTGEAVRLNAVPREEVGTGTSSASAALTVSLTGKYSAAKKITITPEGNTARMGLYDNVVLSPTGTNSFDVHVFDAAGTRIASAFRYAFQGV